MLLPDSTLSTAFILVTRVCRADTFFIATGYEGPLPDGDGHAGLDISHRGGFPGFVRMDGPGTLKWPDYLGNLTFTTLGEPVLPWQTAQAFLAKQNGCITSIILMSSENLGPSMGTRQGVMYGGLLHKG